MIYMWLTNFGFFFNSGKFGLARFFLIFRLFLMIFQSCTVHLTLKNHQKCSKIGGGNLASHNWKRLTEHITTASSFSKNKVYIPLANPRGPIHELSRDTLSCKKLIFNTKKKQDKMIEIKVTASTIPWIFWAFILTILILFLELSSTYYFEKNTSVPS